MYSLDKRFSLYLLPYLLTPWCRVLLEELTGLQLVKKFPAFNGTRRFITALTSIRHPSLSWASPVQSIYSHPTSWRSIPILSTHLRLGLPSGLFPSGFPTKTLYTPSPHPYAPHAQPISYIICINHVLMLRSHRHYHLPAFVKVTFVRCLFSLPQKKTALLCDVTQRVVVILYLLP